MARSRQAVDQRAEAGELARAGISDLKIGFSARNAAEWDRLADAVEVFELIETTADHQPARSTEPHGSAYAETVHRSPTARLFVAVDPPPNVCEQLAAWARTALRGMNRRSGDTPARVLDAELLHVTLCFLGNRPVAEINAIAAQLAACDGQAGELSAGAPLWLPPRRPRTLAVELHDEQGRLALLQKSVVAAIEKTGSEPLAVKSEPAAPAKHRHFRPHITVARMRGGTAPRERALSPTPALSFTPGELILYRSWLSPDGASYEALASHAIG